MRLGTKHLHACVRWDDEIHTRGVYSARVSSSMLQASEHTIVMSYAATVIELLLLSFFLFRIFVLLFWAYLVFLERASIHGAHWIRTTIFQNVIDTVAAERVSTGEQPDVVIHTAHAYGTRELPILPRIFATGASARMMTGAGTPCTSTIQRRVLCT